MIAPTDTAWWFDILERRLFEAHLGSGAISVHALAGWRARWRGSTPSAS